MQEVTFKKIIWRTDSSEKRQLQSEKVADNRSQKLQTLLI